MALKDDYRRERRRVQNYVNKMKRRGYVFVDEVVPPIPKKITAGSIRRLSSLTPERIRAKSSVIDVSTGEVIAYSQGVRQGLIPDTKVRAARGSRKPRVAKPVSHPTPHTPEAEVKPGGASRKPRERPSKPRKGQPKVATPPTTEKPVEAPTRASTGKPQKGSSKKSKGKEGPQPGPNKGKQSTISADMVAEIEYDNWRYRIRSRGYGEGASMLDRFLDNWEATIGREKTLKAVHAGIKAGLELKDYMFYRTDGALDLINELLMFFPTSVNQFDDLKQFEQYMQEWEDNL